MLVGHSYGGAVISQAAANALQDEALVDIAVLVPDVGESPLRLTVKFPSSALGQVTAAQNYPLPDGGQREQLVVERPCLSRTQFVAGVAATSPRRVMTGLTWRSAARASDRTPRILAAAAGALVPRRDRSSSRCCCPPMSGRHRSDGRAGRHRPDSGVRAADCRGRPALRAAADTAPKRRRRSSPTGWTAPRPGGPPTSSVAQVEAARS
ncbi:hypothetical protein GCM10010446_14330 [Streptomyces enissocaesilis]|uniref:AB hydrolase-1 domain-containing protein n=1 Tax=Streptomyces enissocaesilis TaxID=332589 RepID=A0ABP6JEL7_9ACTN